MKLFIGGTIYIFPMEDLQEQDFKAYFNSLTYSFLQFGD